MSLNWTDEDLKAYRERRAREKADRAAGRPAAPPLFVDPAKPGKGKPKRKPRPKPEPIPSTARPADRVLVLELSGVPPSLNDWMRLPGPLQHAAMQPWFDAIKEAAAAAQAPGFDRARVEVLYWFPSDQRRDRDNFVPKFILDGLRYAGVLKDDDFTHVELAGPWWAGVDPERPRTTIVVMPKLW